MNLHQLRRRLRLSLHQQQKPMVVTVVAAAAVTKFAKCVARSITTMTFSNISLSFQKMSDTNAIIALSLFLTAVYLLLIYVPARMPTLPTPTTRNQILPTITQPLLSVLLQRLGTMSRI